MRNSSLVDALEELKSEYGEVSGEVADLQARLAAMVTRLERVRDAIQSLERLQELAVGTAQPSVEDANQTGDEVDHRFQGGGDAKGGRDQSEVVVEDEGAEAAVIPESSPIAKYLARGGEGRRLRSTQMVADVVDEVDKTITRDQLKTLFFQQFPREEMERLWDRPDNAFGNALARAVKEKLIQKGTRGDVEIYASHAFVKRLREERKSADTKADGEGQ